MTPENKRSGYIKLYRSLLDQQWLASDPIALAIWTLLLLKANRNPMKVRADGVEIEVPPGSLVIGVRSFAQQHGFDKDAFARRIKRLKECDKIATEVRQEGTIISIRNWDTYQVSDDDGATEVRQECTPTRSKKKEEYNNTSLPEGDLCAAERKTRLQYPPAFESVWKLHPKGNKADAFRAWEKASKAFGQPDLARAITNYLAECKAKKTEPQFRKDLSTFLNKDRFVQYVEQQTKPIMGTVYKLTGE